MRVGTVKNIVVVPNSNGLIASQATALVKPMQTFDELYTSGAIVDPEGNLLPSVYVQIKDKFGKDITQAFVTTTGYYDAWTNQQPDEVFISFKAKGFKDQWRTFSQALISPDIIMEKGESIPLWAVLLVTGAVIAYSKKSGKKVGAFTSSDAMTIFLLIGGVIAFNMVMKILRSLGLGGDPTNNEQSDPKSAFKPGYWQEFSTYTYAITEAQAEGYAKTIHNAFTLFNDDYNAILSVFSAMKTKANVSFLAWVFAKKYNEDLLSFLTDGGGILPWDGLSYSHLQTIIDLVKKLPSH